MQIFSLLCVNECCSSQGILQLPQRVSNEAQFLTILWPLDACSFQFNSSHTIGVECSAAALQQME